MVTVWTEAMQGETDLKRGATLWFPTTGDQGTAVLIPLSLVFFFFFFNISACESPWDAKDDYSATLRDTSEVLSC